MKRILPALAACGFLAVAGPAAADIVHYNCTDLVCEFSHAIGKSVTHEFRGQCDGKGMMQTINVLQRQHCSSTNNAVSCTITVHTDSYDTCSCTNWDPTNGHRADVRINCLGN